MCVNPQNKKPGRKKKCLPCIIPAVLHPESTAGPALFPIRPEEFFFIPASFDIYVRKYFLTDRISTQKYEKRQ
jgi:hypothetical protein